MARRNAPQPRRTNLSDMIDAGLAALRPFLLHQLPNQQDATDWLRQRFPGVRLNTIRDALSWLGRVESAAATLQGGQRLPGLNEIPVDNTIPTNRQFRYVLRVIFEEPNPALRGVPGWDRTVVQTRTYHSNNLLTPGQLQAQVPSDVREAMQRAGVRSGRRSPTPEGFSTFPVRVEVLALTRRRP